MAWEAKPSGHRGRQQAYADAAIQACLTMKVLFGFPSRQTTGFVESLLEFRGLDGSVPGFRTLCWRQKTLPVAIPYRGLPGPLHLLIDSTGIKAEGEGALSGDCCAIPCRLTSGTPASIPLIETSFRLPGNGRS